MKTEKLENIADRYFNMMLHIKETVIRVRKKHCDVSSHMYYLTFIFKFPEYTRNIVMVLLEIFSNIKKLNDYFSQTE